MSADTLITEAEIWGRTIHPEQGTLSPEGAREWLRLRLTEVDTQRVRELSDKASTGTLTPAENHELQSYLNVGRALEFLKAKARISLRNSQI